MSFSGKRYKRTRHENLEEFLKATDTNNELMRTLEKASPVFSYTQIDEATFNFVLLAEGRHMSFDFTLGKEQELERRDGVKIKVLFTKPSENMLHQKITMPDGKLIYFSREFYGNEAKMIVRTDDTDVKATIYYETVE